MPTVCEFVFARATPIYYSGEQISGSVRLRSTKRLQLTAIKLILLGSGRVEWTQSGAKVSHKIEHNDDSSSKVDACIRYSGEEEYYKACERLAESIVLQPGSSYEEQFSFTVPEHCPATCQLKHGENAYQLQLILQRKSTFNKIYHQRLVIKNRRDLNELPLLKEPYFAICQNVGDKSVGFLEFIVPSTGYVPGQLIKYHLEFPFIIDYKNILINLCQSCIYKSQRPVTYSKEVVRVLASNEMLNDRRPDGCLRIPLDTPISTRQHDALMQISYHLAVIVLSHKRKVLQRLAIPITIGTVPLETIANLLTEKYANFCYDNFASTEVPRAAAPLDNNNDFNLLFGSQSQHFDAIEPICQKEKIKISDRIKLLAAHSTHKHTRNIEI